MGKFSRDKGAREERRIVNSLKDQSIAAERVPLSGAMGGIYSGDVHFEVPALAEQEWVFEAKLRANGFKQLYQWIDGNDGLFVRADNKETLVVLPFNAFCRLARGERKTDHANCTVESLK